MPEHPGLFDTGFPALLKFLKREGIVSAGILVLTFAAVYPAAYVVGGKTLGPYGDGGGLGDWMASLFGALADGNAAIWFFTLSPLLAVTVIRLGVAAARRIGRTA